VSGKNVESAVKALRNGEPVIIVDDEARENEGDIVIAAARAKPENLNFMIREAGGIMCVPLTAERAERLSLNPMTHNTDRYQTPFTVSVDSRDAKTGVSVSDRLRTIKAIVSEKSEPSALVRPGHLFPLVARKGGVLERAGHTEASVDLLKIAGMKPVAVIAEIMNRDGSMAGMPELRKFAGEHSLKLVSVKDIIAHRLSKGMLVKRVSSASLPTEFGNFTAYSYTDILYGHDYLALVKGNPAKAKEALVRVHSGCVTGDIFHSLRCDCRQQLEYSLKRIARSPAGVFLHIPSHEGRGIGLSNKISAYRLQEEGRDTVEANTDLGFPADMRNYGIGAQILRDLGLKRINIMTNNPKKIVGLSAYGLKVAKVMPVKSRATRYNAGYMKSKKEKMFHDL
jgi:3,4-dihydroxy 2-butanone 4-phosphate synthase/GTP cyclohydrolase II